jgi:hypothetical protein
MKAARKPSGKRRPNWSRRLPRPLVIPDVMTLTTLADVRAQIAHLPAQHRDRSTWQHVVDELNTATFGGDTVDVSVALRLVLMLENVPCQPK